MKLSLLRICTLSTLSIVLTALVLVSPNHEARAASKHIRVYTNNIENLLTPQEKCAGNWRELIDFMDAKGHRPNIFIVQQVTGKQVKRLTQYMNKMMPKKNFTYVIAEKGKNIKPQGTPCKNRGDTGRGVKKGKKFQSNAIIFSKKRYTYISSSVYLTYRKKGGSCKLNNRSRAKTLKVGLREKDNGTYVSVASLHWASGKRNGPACAKKNAQEFMEQLRQPLCGPRCYPSIQIAGGDLNTTTKNKTGWYKTVRSNAFADVGLKDKVWTFKYSKKKKRRIDFLFVRGAKKVAKGEVVRFKKADKIAKKKHPKRNDKCSTDHFKGCHYSEHRAVFGKIRR